MRHAGDLDYTEQEAPRHSPVLQWVKEETQTAGGGGAVGDFREGILGLWGTTGDSQLVQVPGTVYDGRGQWMAGSGGQLKKILEELDANCQDPGTGRVRPKDIRFF